MPPDHCCILYLVNFQFLLKNMKNHNKSAKILFGVSRWGHTPKTAHCAKQRWQWAARSEAEVVSIQWVVDFNEL